MNFVMSVTNVEGKEGRSYVDEVQSVFRCVFECEATCLKNVGSSVKFFL